MHLTVVQNKRRPNQKIFTIWPGQSEFFFGNRFEIRLSPDDPGPCKPMVRFVPNCEKLPDRLTLGELMPHARTSTDFQLWTDLSEPISFFAISDNPETDETIEIIFYDSPFE